MSDIKADVFLDITNLVCPMTFVKAKATMEDMEVGQIIEIRMNEGEPIQNVPRSLKEEGHEILKVINNNDGTYTIFVKKGWAV